MTQILKIASGSNLSVRFLDFTINGGRASDGGKFGEEAAPEAGS